MDGEVYDVLTNETVEIVQDQNGANTDGGMMRDLMAGLGAGVGLLSGLPINQGSSDLSLDERMTKQMKRSDAKSNKSIKELHDLREEAGDWLCGLTRIPYNKKW